jgi:anti-sigma-K factor RskA
VPAAGALSAAAVTIEPEGGSAQPTSPVVLVGPLKRS